MTDETTYDDIPTEGSSRRQLFRCAGITAGALAGGGLLGAFRAGPAGAGHTPVATGLFEIFKNPVRQYDSRQPQGSMTPPSPSPSPSPTGLLIGGATGMEREIVFPVSDQPEDINALLLNITVADTVGTGFLMIYPSDTPRPNASIINWWGPGQIHANQVVTAVSGPNLGVKSAKVFVSAGSACHLIIDAYGYYESPAVPPPPPPP